MAMEVITPTTVKQAMENDIFLLCFPLNCSHALQSLDVGVFPPLKKRWKEVLKDWFRESRMQNATKVFPSS